MAAQRVTTMEVRARIGDMLNRVALRHDEFIIERRGKPLAALVPIERLEQMRRAARESAAEFWSQPTEGPAKDLSEDEVMAIALEAQREARAELARDRAKKTKRRRK